MNYSKLHPNFFQRGGYSPVQFSSSQFIPTYAGAPIAEAKANAEQIAGIYHQNIADLTKIDLMNANRKIIPSEGDKAENEKINTRLAEQFKNITAKGDMENQTLQVNALLREYINDPAVKALTESRANADREKAFQEEARSKGATIVLDNPAEGHQTVTYDEKGRPQYNIYQGTGQIKLDWQGRKAKIADELKADASPMEVKAAANDIRGYIATGRWEGISGGVDKNGKPTGKVGRQLDNLMTAYQQTAEYTQEKAVDMRELQQQGLSPEEASIEADKLARQRMLSEGLLRTYSKTDKDYVRDWVAEKEDTKAPPFVPGVDLGARVGGPVDTLMDIFDRQSRGFQNPENYNMTPSGPGGFYDPKFKDSSATLGTPEQQEQFTTLARAAVKWNTRQKELEDPTKKVTDPLAEFYKGDPKEGEKKEKEFLFSDDTYKTVKEFQKYIGNRMKFPLKEDYNFETPLGKKMYEADNASLQTFWQERKFLDLDTNEVFSPTDGKKFNEKFAEAMPDLSKATISGRTGAVNLYGTLNKDFADAVFVNYNDGKGKTGRYLMAQPETRQNRLKYFASDLWYSGVQQPYTKVDKTIPVGGGKKVKISYEDREDQGIFIHSVDGQPMNQMMPADDYQLLLQGILEYAVESSK